MMSALHHTRTHLIPPPILEAQLIRPRVFKLLQSCICIAANTLRPKISYHDYVDTESPCYSGLG